MQMAGTRLQIRVDTEALVNVHARQVIKHPARVAHARAPGRGVQSGCRQVHTRGVGGTRVVVARVDVATGRGTVVI